MKSNPYIQLQEKYGGKFVATVNGKVVVSAKTMKNLFQKMKKDEITYDEKVVIGHILPKGAICVYRISTKN